MVEQLLAKFAFIFFVFLIMFNILLVHIAMAKLVMSLQIGLIGEQLLTLLTLEFLLINCWFCLDLNLLHSWLRTIKELHFLVFVL